MQQKKVTIINDVPIFPLPNLVFFPKTFLPLHIFEPRYRKMVEDALQDKNLIAMALLKEGWEHDYFGAPEVYDIACVGKIQQTEKQHDGKYNIMLYGMTRVRILKFVREKPYRVARVKYLRDTNFDPDRFDERKEADAFIRLIRRYLKQMGVEHLDELLKLKSHSLESIVNQIASIMDFSSSQKQAILEMDSLEARYDEIKRLLNERLVSIKIAKNVRIVPKDPSLN